MHEVTKVEPTRVRVSLGFTATINYQSIREDISVESSALPNESSADAVDRVHALVEEKLVEKFTETKEALSEAGLGES
jgi:hypothetical protein